METTRIQQNQTERIRATALNSSGAFITGLTDVLLEIRRKSDGFYFDFDDTTFKNSGWTTRQQQMTELDATNSAGVYYYDFNTTGLSDDEYFMRSTSVTATNLPAEGELKVGDYVDNIDASILAVKAKTDLLPADPASETNVDAVEAKVDIIDTNVDTIQVDVGILKKIETGRWKITGNQLLIYDDDASTVLYTFDLKDSAGSPASQNVFERDPA